MACEEIYLVDDGNAAVSLPDTPLLGALPGTGGLLLSPPPRQRLGFSRGFMAFDN